ncbi:MAG: 50S ribosomal protein L25 [Candidatus Margulisbacteria bacterium]|nr:50S ribosomal protein L25 [Candidatus Margulisiibacteriota bacterium]
MAKTKIELKADKREELGKKAKKLRLQGVVPAVIYGRKFKSTSVSINLKDYNKQVLQSESGHNLIFSLNVSDNGKSKLVPVITQDIQRDALTGTILHLDFMHINMDEAIKTSVPVELLGIPVGVKDDGGVLVHGLREIEIKCLPAEIPDKYDVDVSALAINDSLHVSDLKISTKIEIQSNLGDMIATVSPPTKEEEVAAPVLTPEEAEAAAAAAAEGAEAVAEEGVKEKSAPGAAPAAKPAAEAEKKEKKEKK